jgi:uncharacterized membrane protein
MKYIHSVIGLVFGCFAVMTLAGVPVTLIMVDGIAAALMGAICMMCGLLCRAFLDSAAAAERYEREDAQDLLHYQARIRARNNG